MKKRTHEKRKPKNGMLSSAMFGALTSLALLIALLALFSLIGLASNNPHSLLSPFSFFSIYASAFLGGFISAKKNKGPDIIYCGALCGCMVTVLLSLVLWIFALALNVTSEPISWLYRGLMILASTVGSLLAASKSQKMPKRKRR